MKPLPRLILRMVADLSVLLGRVIDGKEERPAKRIREVWRRHEAALAKAEADARANEELD